MILHIFNINSLIMRMMLDVTGVRYALMSDIAIYMSVKCLVQMM